ncbi:aspartate aminotransferase family protein [Haloferacaceae archaeon DSL9]
MPDRHGASRDEGADRIDTQSHAIVDRARGVIPGGAQTGLRRQAYDPEPIAFAEADGATMTTVDGEAYLDYHLAFGPIILGHNHPTVDERVAEVAADGILYGAGTTPLEVTVAERLVDLIPSVERVNFCNSGSEATYHAIRLARSYTGNERVLKFEGCYHGWHDYVDISVYPPADRVGVRTPESDGMLASAVENTLVRPFNDPEAFVETVEGHADDLAAVILEPVPHSVGCLLPTDEFLQSLREATAEHDIPLIFDEVITGFRHSVRGMQHELGVTPDLTCLAKAMGNGYPIAAVGGREDILSQAGGDNESGVVISGTYSGHPLGLAATEATLDALESDDVVGHVSRLGDRVRAGLTDLVADRGLDARVVGYRSIFSLQFGAVDEPTTYADVVDIDRARFREYAAGMRNRGHFFTPNPFKRHHLSLAHADEHIDRYLDDAASVLASIDADSS